MTATDFINVMIQELQQQDPLDPTDSSQLLTQMTQISTLQSNSDMQDTLESLTLQQSIGAGSNMIGRYATGLDSSGNSIEGIVTGASIENDKVYLSLESGDTLPMDNLTDIYAVYTDGTNSSDTSTTTE